MLVGKYRKIDGCVGMRDEDMIFGRSGGNFVVIVINPVVINMKCN